MSNWTYQNNIVANGNYGFLGMHAGSGSCDNNLWTAYAILNACVTGYVFDHNLILGGTARGWPAGNPFASPPKAFMPFTAGDPCHYPHLPPTHNPPHHPH